MVFEENLWYLGKFRGKVEQKQVEGYPLRCE